MPGVIGVVVNGVTGVVEYHDLLSSITTQNTVIGKRKFTHLLKRIGLSILDTIYIHFLVHIILILKLKRLRITDSSIIYKQRIA